MEKQNSSCAIPGDIITYDILTRVPAESLVRFRCVCKTWSNLFDNNKLFIKLHSQRYDNKSSSAGFIDFKHVVDPSSHEYQCITSLEFINHNDKKRSIIPFNSSNILFDRRRVYILHSLNGLLLLHCYRDNTHKYYVYNPITRCSTIIPLPMNHLKLDDRHCFCLCYDPLIEKHKVVFLETYKNSNRHDSSPSLRNIRIFTVGDGVGNDGDPWREIVVPDAFHLSDHKFYVDRLYLFHPSNYFSKSKPRDYLHWMVKPRGSDEYYILRLDATREVYVKIKLPTMVSTLKLKCVLNELEGLLCLSHYAIESNVLRVWTLENKDYNRDEDEHEWEEIIFNFSMEEIKGNSSESYIQPLTILTIPRKKLLFAHCSYTFRGAPFYNYFDEFSYYSYDVELKQLEMIYGPTCSPSPLQWHVNSFASC